MGGVQFRVVDRGRERRHVEDGVRRFDRRLRQVRIEFEFQDRLGGHVDHVQTMHVGLGAVGRAFQVQAGFERHAVVDADCLPAVATQTGAIDLEVEHGNRGVEAADSRSLPKTREIAAVVLAGGLVADAQR
ncbi:hypothetical protein BEN78_04635 [Xanthomonas citri pv. mangiferaeindicae]|nr:hypothetical protein BEN78_04635 [Xanthomonas citri pv. mangiferaeindicae]